MKTNKLISEAAKISAEIISVTSAAGATSIPVDMAGYSRAHVVAAVNTTFNAVPITIDIMQGTAASAAGSSAVGSKAGLTIGSSVNTSIPTTRGVQSMLLTLGTDGTGATGNAVTISVGSKTRTFAWSTSTALHNSSAWSTSKLYFGSTVGSTVDTGQQLAIAMLGSAARSTLAFGPTLVMSTPATNTLQLTLSPDHDANLGFGATGATQLLVADVRAAVAAFDVDADELTSSSNQQFLSVKASTASTAAKVAVTVIRAGARYAPHGYSGNLSTVNYAT